MNARRVLAIAVLLALPPGAAMGNASSAGWRATLSGNETVVRGPAWKATVDGRWRVPVVTTRGMKAGPSLDGNAIVLADAFAKPDRTTTSFVVVKKLGVQTIDLTGRWEFDAVSPDATTLYLTEAVGENAYWVRSVDVATGNPRTRLAAKSIAPAPARPGGVETEPMQGVPVDRVTSVDGKVVYTLYDGPGHPFVHMLDTTNGGVLCYDLPPSMRRDARTLSLRRGPKDGLVDVLRARKVVAQIVDPALGPAVRVAGTSAPPVTA
jgi:hypothetical protein